MLYEDWLWSLIILGISIGFLLKIDVQGFLKNFCTSNQLGNQEVDLNYVNNLKRKKIDSDSDEDETNDKDKSSENEFSDDDEPDCPLLLANKTLQGLHKQCSPPSSPPLKGFQD